jgi:hypothetical protein
MSMDFGRKVVGNNTCLAKFWYAIIELNIDLPKLYEKVNWEQNIEACCRLGMTPITFAENTPSKCFNALIGGEAHTFHSELSLNLRK